MAPCESGIGLSGVSAELKPLNRTESGRKCVKTSVEVIRQDFLQLLLTVAYKTLAQCLSEDIRLFMSVEAYEVGQRHSSGRRFCVHPASATLCLAGLALNLHLDCFSLSQAHLMVTSAGFIRARVFFSRTLGRTVFEASSNRAEE